MVATTPGLSNALLGWQNNVTRPNTLLTNAGAVASPAGLTVANLKNDQGAPSLGWQTGQLEVADLLIDTQDSTSTWRAICLARTNLSTAAVMRIQIGARSALYADLPDITWDFTFANLGNSLAALTAAGWTYGRTTQGTIESDDGHSLNLAPAGQPRANAKGLLLEPSSTNFVNNSNSGADVITSAAHTETNGSSDVAKVYSGANVTKITFGASDYRHGYVLGFPGASNTGTIFCVSVWVYIPSGTGLTDCTIYFENATSAVNGTADLTKLDQWQRIRAYGTATASTARMTVGPAGSITAGKALYFSCPQAEGNITTPTSYIPTTGSAANRAADTLIHSNQADFVNLVASGNFTFATDYEEPYVPTTFGSGFITQATDTVTLRAQTQATSIDAAFTHDSAGTPSLTLPNAPTPNTTQTIMVAVDATSATLAATGNASSATLSGRPAGTTPVSISLIPAQQSVYAKRVKVWGKRLTAGQTQAYATTGSTITTADGPVTYDSGTIGANVAPNYQQSINVIPVTTGQACRITATDAANVNTDGYINIPLVYAGPCWQPQLGPSFGSTFGRDAMIDETQTRGGQEFPVLRFRQRRWNIELNAVRDTEVYAQADALDAASRDGRNVFFCPDITAADLNKQAVYGRCKPQSDFSFPYLSGNARNWKANIVERI